MAGQGDSCTVYLYSNLGQGGEAPCCGRNGSTGYNGTCKKLEVIRGDF